MRRSDREIENRREIDEILHGAEVLHLAFAVDGGPYVIPISFGYDGTSLYIHTAKVGRKIDCIGANPRICFQVERGVRLVTDPEDACAWSFAFESVIGYGVVSELMEAEERTRGLNLIMRHYSERSWDFDPGVMTATRVWRIAIEFGHRKEIGRKGRGLTSGVCFRGVMACVGVLLGPFLARKIRRQATDEFANLKALCEQGREGTT